MNEGFVAAWLATMFVILYTTGWQRFVADRVPGRIILLVLAAAAACHAVAVPLGPACSIRGSAAVVVVAAIVSAIHIRSIRYSLLLMMCALATGFVWLWIGYLYATDPVLVLYRPEWDGPLVAGMLSGMLTGKFRAQFSLVALAAAIAPFADRLAPMHAADVVIGGSAGWWDGLLIGLTAARLTGSVKGWIHRSATRLRDGRFGQRGGHS